MVMVQASTSILRGPCKTFTDYRVSVYQPVKTQEPRKFVKPHLIKNRGGKKVKIVTELVIDSTEISLSMNNLFLQAWGF